MAIKPITNKQIVSSEAINRANQTSTKGLENRPNVSRSENAAQSFTPGADFTKNYSVTLEDVDTSIINFVKNIIRPSFKENNEVFKVPVIYGNEERWVSARKRGILKDKNGALLLPLIMLKRTEVSKNSEFINGMEQDLNRNSDQFVVSQQWSKQNRYDRFAVLQGISPISEFTVTTPPNFVNINYDFVIWTNFISQMNGLVEAFTEFNNQYWGEGQERKFFSLIENISDASEMNRNGERFIKSTFSVNTRAALLPEDYNSVVTNKISNLKKIKSVAKTTFGESLL